MSGGGIREILCEGGGLPNGGTAILEGGVLTLEETMVSSYENVHSPCPILIHASDNKE